MALDKGYGPLIRIGFKWRVIRVIFPLGSPGDVTQKIRGIDGSSAWVETRHTAPIGRHLRATTTGKHLAHHTQSLYYSLSLLVIRELYSLCYVLLVM